MLLYLLDHTLTDKTPICPQGIFVRQATNLLSGYLWTPRLFDLHDERRLLEPRSGRLSVGRTLGDPQQTSNTYSWTMTIWYLLDDTPFSPTPCEPFECLRYRLQLRGLKRNGRTDVQRIRDKPTDETISTDLDCNGSDCIKNRLLCVGGEGGEEKVEQ